MKIGSALVILSIVLFSTLLISPVECKSALDYEVIFRVGNLCCLFDFPDEAHKGDTYSYELNVTAEATVHIETFEMNIFYWEPTAEHVQTYDIASYTLMDKGDNFVREIQFTVPSIDIWHTIYVNFWISTEETSEYPVMVLGVFTTRIVDKTYGELQSENFDLEYNYTALKSDYEGLTKLYEALQNDYNELVTEHNNLLSDYNSLQTDYNYLMSRYYLDVENARNLMYLFIITTIVFITTTVYFAKRKPKTT